MKTWRRAESSVKRHFFFRYLALLPCTCRCCCTKSQKFARALFLPLHVRRAHGAFVRPHVFTVAILAQGTNRGDALCAALLLRRVGSNPTATTFRFWTFSSILRPQTSDILCITVYER